MTLQEHIEYFSALQADLLDPAAALPVFADFLEELGGGRVRAAARTPEGWRVNTWVKRGILLGFRLGQLADASLSDQFRFFDKSTYPLKRLSLNDGVRLVPGGSAIRSGAFVARGVVCMPPMYINVGAYVDEGSMIDSHALVGSCAQVGKRVHLSAAAQVGGVLEPVGALPVIIEDDVFVGGNCGIYEGTIVRERAVIAAGVILTGGTAVYDTVHECILRKRGDEPLTIPEGAVVVAGSRPLASAWAAGQHLHIASPAIIKYRDSRTDAATALEEGLR
jgi:2,3,4,5-tetrahydropyridine-2,6-dicarboxylate N-succinyltransferase